MFKFSGFDVGTFEMHPNKILNVDYENVTRQH
jgi:hypothetical protein